MYSFNTKDCDLKCSGCMVGKIIQPEPRDYVFLFDDFSDYELESDLFSNIDDIITSDKVQCLYMSYMKFNLTSNYDHLYTKCAERNLLSILQVTNPKVIFAFGIRSYQFLLDSKSNYSKNKLTFINNSKVRNVYVYAMPNLNIMFKEFSDKYNPLLLETRFNLQLVLKIIEDVNNKRGKLNIL